MSIISFRITEENGSEIVITKDYYGTMDEAIDFFLMCLRAGMGYNLPGTLEYTENSNPDFIKNNDDLVE